MYFILTLECPHSHVLTQSQLIYSKTRGVCSAHPTMVITNGGVGDRTVYRGRPLFGQLIQRGLMTGDTETIASDDSCMNTCSHGKILCDDEMSKQYLIVEC